MVDTVSDVTEIDTQTRYALWTRAQAARLRSIRLGKEGLDEVYNREPLVYTFVYRNSSRKPVAVLEISRLNLPAQYGVPSGGIWQTQVYVKEGVRKKGYGAKLLDQAEFLIAEKLKKSGYKGAIAQLSNIIMAPEGTEEYDFMKKYLESHGYQAEIDLQTGRSLYTKVFNTTDPSKPIPIEGVRVILPTNKA